MMMMYRYKRRSSCFNSIIDFTLNASLGLRLSNTELLLLLVHLRPKKADKTALEGKVSRVQFESATEQLGTMIRQLLDKVSVQEQDWHRVVRKLSTEMDCKVRGAQRGVRKCVPALSDRLTWRLGS